MSLRIHNSLTRRVEAFAPIQAGKVGMYVCGITVYDRCHLGHARMMIAFDVVVRWLRASGLDVTYVRNITDVDDKIIRRANERGMPIGALTRETIGWMHEDLDALGVERPTHEPRATDHIPGMVGMIRALLDKDLAYRSQTEGDINFAVRAFPGYGKLSGRSLDDMRAGERVAVDTGKRDPMDFVLWKAAKPGEPADARWSTELGDGRPGWHIECSAMSRALLGDRFDIHGGGMDLTFPHHENEIAQSEGAIGARHVNVWMHNGLLNLDDEKMSKSLGNFLTIRDVLGQTDGESIRFFMLRTHYRSPFNFSDALLKEAQAGLKRLYTALDGIPGMEAAAEAEPPLGPARADEPEAQRAFRAAMDDDFNTPRALAVLFELAGDVNRTRSADDARLLRRLAGTLGLLQQAPRAFLQGGRGADEETARIEQRIQARADAKAARRFDEADRIRRELAQEGIQLKDGPAGTTWVRG